MTRYTVPGNPLLQTIRGIVYPKGSPEILAELIGYAKEVNELGLPIILLANKNQKDWQVTFENIHTDKTKQLLTFKAGPRGMPEETPYAVYQGDLRVEAENGKRFRVKTEGDTTHDFDLPFMISDKYSCCLRGIIIKDDVANAALSSHACVDYNSEFVRLGVQNETGDKTLSESDYDSAPSSEEDGSSGKDKHDFDENEESKLRDAALILQKHGIMYDETVQDPSRLAVTQTVIFLITCLPRAIRPYESLFTVYNTRLKAAPREKQIRFWKENDSGEAPEGEIKTECQCFILINEEIEKQNQAKKSLNESHRTQQFKVEIARFRVKGLIESNEDDGDAVECENLKTSCPYARWRFERMPSEQEMANETRIRATITDVLSNQRTQTQAELNACDYGGILDALREDESLKTPRIIYRFLGFPELDRELEEALIEEINAIAGPAVKLAYQNHTGNKTTLCVDPGVTGGYRLRNGPLPMPCDLLMGFEIGIVMPTSKIPYTYRTVAIELPVYVFDQQSSLVPIKVKHDPLGKYNAASFSHSCKGTITTSGFDQHERDESEHLSCLGKSLFDRLHQPLTCLAHLSDEHHYRAADFLFYIRTLDVTGPNELLCIDRNDTKCIVPQVVDTVAMPFEMRDMPPGTFVVPCDCARPFQCSAFVIRNEKLHQGDLKRANPYTPGEGNSTLSKKAIERNLRTIAKERLNCRPRTIAISEIIEDPTLDVIHSMASGDLAFNERPDDGGPVYSSEEAAYSDLNDESSGDSDDEASDDSDDNAPGGSGGKANGNSDEAASGGSDEAAFSDSDASDDSNESAAVPRRKRGGRKRVSDGEDEDESTNEAEKPAQEPAQPPAPPKAKRVIIPSVSATQVTAGGDPGLKESGDSVSEAEQPKKRQREPDAHEQTKKLKTEPVTYLAATAAGDVLNFAFKGKCPQCQRPVTSADRGRIKVASSNSYYHFDCYNAHLAQGQAAESQAGN